MGYRYRGWQQWAIVEQVESSLRDIVNTIRRDYSLAREGSYWYNLKTTVNDNEKLKEYVCVKLNYLITLIQENF